MAKEKKRMLRVLPENKGFRTEMFMTGEKLRVADLHCRIDKYLAEEIWRERERQ